MAPQTMARRMWADFTVHPLLLLILLIPAVMVEFEFRVPSVFLYYFLPIVGFSAATLSLVHLTRKFPSLSEPEQMRNLLFQIERVVTIPIVIFFGHSLLVLANGGSDYSAPVEQRFQIISKSTFEVDLQRPLLMSWAEVKAAHESDSLGYVLLSGSEKTKLWGGEMVLAHVHVGNLGMPWISGMARDDEYYFRQALQRSPRSAAIWKNLVVYYQNLKRWDDMVKTVYEFLDIYPYEYKFVASIASQLVSQAGRYDQAIPLLEYATAMGKHYDDYQLLGHAWQWKGDKQKAIEIYQASIPLAPHDWEVFFHLAETFSEMGRSQDAVAMYRQVLERRPDFPEVESLLRAALVSSERSLSK